MQNLYRLYDQLKVGKDFISTITINVEKFYYKKIKPKKKFGKYQIDENGTIRLRHLIPPVNSLKIIQQTICAELQKIDLPDCMYGSVQESNNILNALQHIENKFFYTIDLKDFFTRINNKQVHYVFMENGYCWEAARILTKLTTYKGGLPQGAPSSPVLANLAFKKTVLQLNDLIKGHSIAFTTFLDDLTFSSKKDFKHLTDQIPEIIRVNKFFPHYKKIHYRENYCDVTGLFVGNGRLRIHPKMLLEGKTNIHVRKYIESVQTHYQQYLLNKSMD